MCLRMLECRRATVLQGVLTSFRKKWRWCLWKINLILRILWPLVYSFWHCLHSYSRFVSEAIHRHGKTTLKLWPVGWFYYQHKVNPHVGGCSFFYSIALRCEIVKLFVINGTNNEAWHSFTPCPFPLRVNEAWRSFTPCPLGFSESSVTAVAV